MQGSKLKRGDWVVYRKQKVSTSPGPRADSVVAAQSGETYSYLVDKYWVVDEVREDGQVILRTRRGKQHQIEANDPRLRPAKWWERILFSSRYRSIVDQT